MHVEKTSERHNSAHFIVNVYMVREAVHDLTKFLDRYPELSRINREDYFLFAIKRLQVLKENLISISQEAFLEAVQLSVNILSFRECLDAKYRDLAEGNLRRINQLLCLEVRI